MNGVCLNSWEPYGCEWTVGYLWRWMNWITRLDVIVLALMLAYVVVVVIHVSYRCHLARRERGIDSASRSKLAAVLSIELGGLKAIAAGAPYLGLAGTCVGMMSAIVFGGNMEENTFLAKLGARMAATLITTAAGILVAVPATCFYNYLCTRINLLESKVSNREQQRGRHFWVTQRFPLTKRFSQLPAFALIAASGLAVLVAVYTSYSAPREPTGFNVGLVPERCVYEGDDRLIVLRLSDAGELFINQTQEDWISLPEVLSEIYGSRVHRTLYLRADDGVPFQTVADAIDIVENANAEPHQAVRMGADKLDITVRLITPRAMNTSCVLKPVASASFSMPLLLSAARSAAQPLHGAAE